MPPAPAAPRTGYPPAPNPPLGAPVRGPLDIVGGQQSGERARKALWAGLVAFAVQAVCSVIVLASLSDFYRTLFDAIGSGRRLTTAQTTPPTSTAYLVASGVSQLASVVALVVGILFLIWFHKALSNARSLGLPLTRSPAWGVVGFFIPIINFWFPYQSMRDLIPVENPARPLVLRWWLTYLGAGLFTSTATFAALFSPVAGAVLVVPVVALYAIAAVTLRELISVSSQVADELAARHRTERRLGHPDRHRRGRRARWSRRRHLERRAQRLGAAGGGPAEGSLEPKLSERVARAAVSRR